MSENAKKKPIENKSAIIAMAVMVSLAVLCLIVHSVMKPKPEEGSKRITVEVTHRDETVNTFEINTDEKYLYDAMRQENLIGDLEDGYFTTVDGEAADSDAQEWWGYTKGGEYVSYGVGECVIYDGDHFEFTFNIGW